MLLAEQEIASTFEYGTAGVRHRLVCGMLEHALETAPVRQFFVRWACDPTLGEAGRSALEWAEEHDESDSA